MKKVPIGITDFEEIIEKNFYYVDKTSLISWLITEGVKAILFPRPRRFGKTLNLSMLQYFFEKNSTSKKHLFNNLAISKQPDCMKHQGLYPVIFLSFKSVKHNNWADCYENIKHIIIQEVRRHADILNSSELSDIEKNDVRSVIVGSAHGLLFQHMLRNFSMYLHRMYKTKVIILIDEYDTPIHAGYIHGYYEDIISFMRNFLGEGLKDNSNLEIAVVTGILRVAKESIFSGLNNLAISSLIDESSEAIFGYTQPEVAQMLTHYGLHHTLDTVKSWYDGYQSGHITIYNPWSINNYVNNNGKLDCYWVNTSSNDIVKDLLKKCNPHNKQDLEDLINGSRIAKELYDTIVLQDLDIYPDVLWSFLLLSGYLTFANVRMENRKKIADLFIPNEEVLILYESIISSWFKRVETTEYTRMINYLLNGSVAEFARLFSIVARESLSYFDVADKTAEQFYHAFVLGMMVDLRNSYEIRSNRESGYGRYDVMLIPKDIQKHGVILEFKKVDTDNQETLDIAANKALQQICDKQYETDLRMMGIKNIIKLGIAFEGKKVLVRSME